MARRKKTASKQSLQQPVGADPPAEPGSENTGPEKNRIVAGVVTAVLSAAIIGLVTSFIVSQKNEIIATLREDLDNSTEELKEAIEKERNDRIKLAIAVSQAGVDIPLATLMEMVAQNRNSDDVKEFVLEIASNIPTIEREGQYADLEERFASIGRTTRLYTPLPDGSGILGFSAGFPTDLEAAAAKSIKIQLVGSDGQVSEVLPFSSEPQNPETTEPSSVLDRYQKPCGRGGNGAN